MAILFDEKKKIFYLHTKKTSYIMGFLEEHLVHIHWGKRLNEISSIEQAVPFRRRNFSHYTAENDQICLDNIPQEYPTYGNTDLRSPAFHAQYADGTTITAFRYVSHSIINGKPELDGLPHTFRRDDKVETLDLVLFDEKTKLEVHLLYSVFEDKDAITRSVKVVNTGDVKADIKRIMSANVDLFGKEFDVISLCGATQRERYINRSPLTFGEYRVDSKRGASSHMRNPFIAVASKYATEDVGEVYSMNLLYSGNFTADVYVDQYGMTRMGIGINDFDFNWKLDAGETFQSPEAVLVYSDEGIGAMSRIYHDLYRENLCRSKYAMKVRPILINNWEATYFDFNEEKILEIATKAKKAGVELMVLDDGWFGKRNNDECAMGDWWVNTEKLPNGIDGLAEKVEALGMKFGLWFEPEAISPDSDLYRQHPDWHIQVPGRTTHLGRSEYLLDLANDEVCDYLIDVIGNIIRSAKISYVKWDMNRNMTDIGSPALPADRQRETAHRYMLGLYKIMDALTSEFEDILFESCSGGGGRFDAGMLYYMPQTWASDNSDGINRLLIQYGTSLAYPAVTMGSHVSAVPNHQIHRTTSFKTRYTTASMGQFGFELDITKMEDEEFEKMAECIKHYKKVRETVQFGDMYRLLSPFEGNYAAWQFLSKDGTQVYICCSNVLAVPNGPYNFVKCRNLEPDAIYYDEDNDIRMSGAELMSIGLPHLEIRDFDSKTYFFKKQ